MFYNSAVRFFALPRTGCRSRGKIFFTRAGAIVRPFKTLFTKAGVIGLPLNSFFARATSLSRTLVAIAAPVLRRGFKGAHAPLNAYRPSLGRGWGWGPALPSTHAFFARAGALALLSPLLLCLSASLLYAAPLQIVTTTSDLADIARHVGGDDVVVTALSDGRMDPHHIEPRPSMVQQIRRADALIVVGLDLDGWSDSLIRISQNPKVQIGASGYIDASAKITPIDIPVGKIDGRSGDVHPYGNPHYWLDPLNGILIAETLADRFGQLRPDQRQQFQKNAARFATEIKKALPGWIAALTPLHTQSLVAYHPTWRYFTSRFGLTISHYIELRPGIPPSVSHLMDLERQMKAQQSKIILLEPYASQKEAALLSTRTGAKVVDMAPSIGSIPEVTSYMQLFAYNVRALHTALKTQGPLP